MIDYERVVDSMLFDARVAMLDGGTLELEPCQFSDCIMHVMDKLRQAEKDAARYRWLRDECKQADWDTIGSAEAGEWDFIVDDCINEAMQCKQ